MNPSLLQSWSPGSTVLCQICRAGHFSDFFLMQAAVYGTHGSLNVSLGTVYKPIPLGENRGNLNAGFENSFPISPTAILAQLWAPMALSALQPLVVSLRGLNDLSS